MTDVDVALEALRSDAGVWHTAAGNLTGPMNALAGLTLTGADVSMWAVDRGLDRTYDQARTAVIDLLRQGAENFTNLGNALAAAADTYQREEEANLHRFDSIHR
jgi:hypothetical protein